MIRLVLRVFSALIYRIQVTGYRFQSLFSVPCSLFPVLSHIDWQRGAIKITKRLLITYLIGFIAFSGVGLGFLFNPFGTKSAEAAWFNDSWGYRQTIAITYSSSALTDFQVSFALNTSTLISAGKMQSDCDDIRVTTVGGDILPIWIDGSTSQTTGCNQTGTVVWTKLPAISSNQTLYVYYGNPSAINSEDGDKVFTFYDDFESGSVSNPDWDGTLTCANSTVQTQTTQKYKGANGAESYQSADCGDTLIAHNFGSAGARVMEIRFYDDASITTAGRNMTANLGVIPGTSTVGVNTDTSTTFYVYRYAGSYTTSAVARSTGWHKIKFTQTATTYVVAIDGTTLGSPDTTEYANSTKLTFGSFTIAPAGFYWDTAFARQYAATEPTMGSPGSEEKGTAPVAYWKFDDAQGTTPQDATTNNLDGTMTNFAATPTANSSWQTADNCIAGSCLAFDKANDVITAGTPSQLNDIGPVTLSAWVYPISMGEGSAGIIMSKNVGTTPSAGWLLQFASTNALKLSIDGSTDLVRQTSDSVVTLNQWNHVVLTWDGVITTASSVKIYINGKEVTYATTTNGVARVADTTSTFRIGNDSTGANTFDGKIDEPKVYNQVLTAAQISANYNARGNPEGVSSQEGNNIQNMPAALSNGLVGYWKMDESAANSCTGGSNDSCDSSGNGLDGAWNGDATTSTTAKLNRSVTFDGTGDFTTMGTQSVLSMSTYTVGFWINAPNAPDNSAVETVFDKGNASGTNYMFSWRHNATFQKACTHTVSGGYTASQIASSLSANTWYYITCVYDGTNLKAYLNGTQEASVALGSPDTGSGDFALAETVAGGGAQRFQGKLDDFRVYNRALSNNEVKQLYNWAPGPIGYWKLDEGSGTTAYDISGNDRSITAFTGTPTYTPAKYGTGLNFNGSTQLIQTSNANGQALLGNRSTGTVEFWIYPRALASYGIYFEYGNGTNSYWSFEGDSSGLLYYLNGGVADSTGALSNNTWYHIAMVMDGTNKILYLNGVRIASQAFSSTLSNASEPINWGARNGVSFPANTKMDDLKIYAYARNASQVIEDMNGGHPAPGSPVGSAVGYWRMDEGYGTTAHDSNASTGGAEDLTLSAASWTNAGKFGKAFDGADNKRLSRATDPDIEMSDLDDFSVSLWYKSDSGTSPAARQYLMSDGPGTAAGYAVWANTDDTVCFGVDDDTTANPPEISSCTTTDFYDGAWHHLVGVRDHNVNDKTYLYMDGKLQGTGTADTTTATLDSNSTFYLGDENGTDGTDEFLGDLDEVKIFRSAFTPAQVLLDMNRGQTENLGSLSDKTGTGYESKTSQNQEYCVPGDTATCTAPVGRWDMEEGSNTTANDTSGNGNTGTLTNTPTWAVGKASTGLQFSRTSTQYVNAQSGTTLDDLVAQGGGGMTAEAWIYPVDTGASFYTIMGKDSSGAPANGWPFYIRNSDDSLGFDADFTGGTNTDFSVLSSANAITYSTWQHVALTWTGSGTATTAHLYINGKETSYQLQQNGNLTRASDAAQNFLIGADTSLIDTFNGKMDGVRLFNYVRTPAQIAWDYNQGKPVGYWRMDECQGATINDSSGNGYTGTWSGSGGGNTVPGTCGTSGAWFNGVTGKRNSSLDFDGTDDKVTISDLAEPSGAVSLSAWVKMGTVATDQRIISKWGNTAGEEQYVLSTDDSSSNRFSFAVSSGSSNLDECDSNSSGIYTTGVWYLVTGTYDATTCKIYINGVDYTNKQTDAASGSTQNTAVSVRIGIEGDDGTSKPLDGQIDDARIYNYGLTPIQVKTLYNEGSARFGPTTGAP